MGTFTLLCDLSERLLLYLPSTRARSLLYCHLLVIVNFARYLKNLVVVTLFLRGGGVEGGVSASRDMSPQKFVQNSDHFDLVTMT